MFVCFTNLGETFIAFVNFCGQATWLVWGLNHRKKRPSRCTCCQYNIILRLCSWWILLLYTLIVCMLLANMQSDVIMKWNELPSLSLGGSLGLWLWKSPDRSWSTVTYIQQPRVDSVTSTCGRTRSELQSSKDFKRDLTLKRYLFKVFKVFIPDHMKLFVQLMTVRDISLLSPTGWHRMTSSAGT